MRRHDPPRADRRARPPAPSPPRSDPAWGSLLSRRAARRPGPLPRRRRHRRPDADGGHVLVAAAHGAAALGRAPDRRPRRGHAPRRRDRGGPDRARRRPHAQGARRRAQAGDGVLLRLGDDSTASRRSAARARARPRTRPTPLRIAFSSCQQYQSGYFTPARARGRRGPRPVPLPRRLHLRAGPLAAAHRRARRPHRRRRPRAPTGASTGSRAPTRPAELHRAAPGAARAGRPRGREQLLRQPADALAAAAHRRLPGGVGVDPARGQQARPLPDLPARAAQRERPSCSCSTRASTAPAATTACRGGSSATRRWRGCSPR